MGLDSHGAAESWLITSPHSIAPCIPSINLRIKGLLELCKLQNPLSNRALPHTKSICIGFCGTQTEAAPALDQNAEAYGIIWMLLDAGNLCKIRGLRLKTRSKAPAQYPVRTSMNSNRDVRIPSSQTLRLPIRRIGSFHPQT
ncbi:hypothetical protein PG993_010751 [Apiospora rasikravindrae]|uniref:Uncharacterized protein n=1 Tax=Apiospora rasikravindrae TaxID=990691 RepID=A0ABR1SDI6_9PEZI